MQDQIQLIKKIIDDVLSRLTVDAEIDAWETTDGLRFVVRTQEGGLLIGENGKNLISLNHIIKKIVSKKMDKLGSAVSFSLDVNDYQIKKIEDLKNMARVNAQRVRYFKKEVSLRAMSSFERRVVHMVLADSLDIATSSQGSEPYRSVVIKPYP